MAVAYRILACSLALVMVGCFPPDDGVEPPLETFYYPVGIAMDEAASRLYVVNSNFDLQYNAGTLQAYDLERIRKLANEFGRREPGETVEEQCGELGVKSAADELLAPGQCGPIDPGSAPGGGSILVDAVEIGGFVTDVVFRENQNPEKEGKGRLFMPVRGDATLHWADVYPGHAGEELDCGSPTECDAEHRVGNSPTGENSRGENLPPEPFGIAVDRYGEALVLTHQVNGEVSLFTNDWKGESSPVVLQDVQGGLPFGAVAVASVPRPVLDPSPPSFLLTFRNAAQIRILRYFDDAASKPERPFLDTSAGVPITAVSQGWEARGIATDDSKRAACEALCPGESACSTECADAHPNDRTRRVECERDCRCIEPCAGDAECVASCDACYQRCAAEPVDVFVTNRQPNTLIVGQTQHGVPASDVPTLDLVRPVTRGASRVVLGHVLSASRELLPRAFVICFDSRTIHVYDPKHRQIESIIETGRGPHPFAVDTRVVEGDPDKTHAFGYIGHFTDSYLGVVDLDQGSPTYGRIILTIGRPTPPKESD